MVKTIVLDGAEAAVTFTGANAWLRNDGEKTIYASKNAGISAGADDVVSIPAGGSAPVYDARGIVHIKGAGSVQLIGSNYAVNPFKQPSSNVRDRQTAAEIIPAIALSFGEMAVADVAENVTNTLTEKTTEEAT